ncbi:MAG: hypothetical protein E6760_12420, partial [Eggerthella sp.]|nr:hypothetical protein [Eggerthella sp.]
RFARTGPLGVERPLFWVLLPLGMAFLPSNESKCATLSCDLFRSTTARSGETGRALEAEGTASGFIPVRSAPTRRPDGSR